MVIDHTTKVKQLVSIRQLYNSDEYQVDRSEKLDVTQNGLLHLDKGFHTYRRKNCYWNGINSSVCFNQRHAIHCCIILLAEITDQCCSM